MKKHLITAVLCFASTNAFAAGASSFESCLAQISALATELGVAPVNIVETSSMRMVRIPTSDGSVLITCTREAPYMAVTQSDRQCGVNVNC